MISIVEALRTLLQRIAYAQRFILRSSATEELGFNKE
jgi:hypothetical protein